MEAVEKLLDQFHIEDLSNDVHPSIFDVNDDYDMLIIRLPLFQEKISFISTGFIITKEASYLFDKNEKRLKKLEGHFEGPYKIIDEMTDTLLKAFKKYQDHILDMEETLYTDQTDKAFMMLWLNLKRDILRIERILFRSTAVMQEVIDHYDGAKGFLINHYVDLLEHMNRTQHSAVLQLSKLDYLYNFYNARTNEKMNRLIFALTIVSAIFLPLNLMVGFFGMNTSGLPFTKDSFGTLYASLIMLALISVTSFIVFKWRKKAS